MRIIYCAYREWALKIYEEISKLNHDFLLITNPSELIIEKCQQFKPHLFLLYGWSWIVRREILDIAPCVCLHPSPLPKYRGGSPIQNQIIMGEKESAVTIFYMTEEIDAGDIILQEPLSLRGHLQEVLDRIAQVGVKLTKIMLDGKMDAVPQDHTEATFFKRRQPHESELTIDDLKTKTSEELYDFIRALEDPYPNAFIQCRDNKKLLIKRVEIEDAKA